MPCHLADSPDSIKILLQIRSGNIATTNQNNPDYFAASVLPRLATYTDCALAMEAKIKHVEKNRNKSVVWYLMSDSSATREYLKSKFSDKVLSKLHSFLWLHFRVFVLQLVVMSNYYHYYVYDYHFFFSSIFKCFLFLFAAHNSTIQNLATGIILCEYFI